MNTLIRSARPFGFDHLPQDWFSGFAAPEGKLASNTSVNVKETEENYQIFLLAPGFEKNNFTLKSTEKLLEISGNVQQEEKTEEGKFTRKEFSISSFTRSFTLPEGKVNIEEISANYKDGVLQVTLPKKEVSKPVERLIDIM